AGSRERFDEDFGASDPEEIVDGETIAGEFGFHELAPLVHLGMLWRVAKLRNCAEIGRCTRYADLFFKRGRVGDAGLAERERLEPELLCIADEDSRGLWIKQHQDRIRARSLQPQHLRRGVVGVRGE